MKFSSKDFFSKCDEVCSFHFLCKCIFLISMTWYYQLIKRQICYHKETSQLICSANQLTGFYMIASLAFNELKLRVYFFFLFKLKTCTFTLNTSLQLSVGEYAYSQNSCNFYYPVCRQSSAVTKLTVKTYVGKEKGYMFNNTKKGSEKNRACKRFKTAKPFRLI